MSSLYLQTGSEDKKTKVNVSYIEQLLAPFMRYLAPHLGSHLVHSKVMLTRVERINYCIIC